MKVDIRIDSDAFYPATFSPGDIVDVHSENDADKLYRGRVAAVDDANGTCDVYYYDGFGYERNVPTGERKVRLISPLSDDMSWLIGKEVLVKGPGNVHYTATISPSDGSRGGIGGNGGGAGDGVGGGLGGGDIGGTGGGASATWYASTGWLRLANGNSPLRAWAMASLLSSIAKRSPTLAVPGKRTACSRRNQDTRL